MTFTYTGDLTDNGDFVRFHSGDTVESESVLSDEVIVSLIATEGTKYKAVIAALRYMRRQLIRPDIKADWLSLSGHAAAVRAMDRLIQEKQAEFGLSTYTATVSHAYRPSAGYTEEPDYGNDTD